MPHECTNCSRTFPDGSKEMLSGCPDCGGNKFRYRPAGGNLDGEGTDSLGDEAADGPDESGSAGGSDPGGPATAGTDPDDDARPSAGPPDRSGVANTVAEATRNLREWVGVEDDRGNRAGLDAQFDPPADDAVVDSGGESGTDDPGTDGDQEDAAQASARTSMVEPDDLPDGAAPEADHGTVETERERRSDADGAKAAGNGGGPTTGGENPELSELREELNDQFESIKIVEPGQYELNLMELYDREEYIISLMEDGRYAIEVPETWRDPGE